MLSWTDYGRTDFCCKLAIGELLLLSAVGIGDAAGAVYMNEMMELSAVSGRVGGARKTRRFRPETQRSDREQTIPENMTRWRNVD